MSRSSPRSRPRRRPGRGALAAVLGLLAVGLAPPPPATAAAATAAVAPAAAAADTAAGAPVVATLAGGESVLFARSAQNVLYRRAHHAADDSWNRWESTGGAAAGDPATAHELNRRLSVFTRRDDGHLWWQREDADGGWTGWTDLGAPTGTTAAGTPVVVADDNSAESRTPGADGFVQGNTDGRLELFVRGADGQLWHRMQKSSNGSAWSKWEALPGTWAGGFTALTGDDGRITVAARKEDGRLRVTTQRAPSKPDSRLPDDNWPGWTEIGTGSTGALALAANIRKDGTALLQVFGNRSDGTLWTVGQTAPRSAADPAGSWSGGTALGPALTGRPAVATHSDGRLAVFGLDPQGRATYRTQTAAATGKHPEGIWEGNWRTLGDQTARALTLRPAPGTGNDGFGVFVLDRDADSLHQRTRLALGSADGSREDVWLDWADLATPGQDECSGPGSLDCLNLDSDFGPTLNLADPTSPLSRIGRGLGTLAPTEMWQLRRTDGWRGPVQIANRHWADTCVRRETPDWAGLIHLSLAPCSATDAAQKWLLDPVPAAGTDKSSRRLAGYRLESGAADGTCLTALVADTWPHDAGLAEMIDCASPSENDHSVWKPERHRTDTPGVLGIALDQAARRCEKDTEHTRATCSFVSARDSAAYLAAGGCVVGKVVFNQGGATNNYTVSWTHTTGTQFGIGATTGLTYGYLSQQFSLSYDWLQQDSVTNQLTLNVPPGQYGWIEDSPVRRETIGYWEITVDGRTWTVPGHNLSYAKDETGGISGIATFHSSPTPPSSRNCNQ
ncbi:hypothetical protein [Kitasatospora cineracea]|uniref:hypothetical protein n=1 Tax=Kitasatospora cineracea TaxID=88074 RepID=UPI00381A05EB